MPVITISFVGCCLPDYFSGHHLPVLQAMVDGTTTRKQLCNDLISELNQGVIDYYFEYKFDFKLPYEEVKQAIKDCIFWNEKCKDNDIVFPSLDVSPDDCESLCYAFFVVNCEKESNE